MTKKTSKVATRSKTGRYVSRGTAEQTSTHVKRHAQSGQFVPAKSARSEVRRAVEAESHGNDPFAPKDKTNVPRNVKGPKKPVVSAAAADPELRVGTVEFPGSDEPDYVMVPVEMWAALRERVEDLDDLASARRIKTDLEAGRDELIPIEIADRLIDGESPIKVWRGYRRKTQAQLATETGLDQAYISELESGKKTNPTASVLRALADALDVTIDDLVT